jgi:hypothetical protein
VFTALPNASEASKSFAHRAQVGIRKAFTRAALPWWSVAVALLAGLGLRLFFILVYPEYDGDTPVYGTIAKNMLLHHAYALDNPFHSTLIRLPGYPVFLAIVFTFFGMENYDATRPIQMFIDLGSCLLMAAFVYDHVADRLKRRAALWTLWIACLCPFTADYVAIPLTECNSIFCISLSLFAAGRLIRSIRESGRSSWGYLVLTAAALYVGIQFRPDNGLVAAALVPGIWWYTRPAGTRLFSAASLSPRRNPGLRAVLLCTVLVGLPFIPWTIRNYRVFHVFQPLSSRYCTDPGDPPLYGYMRWTKTWLAEYVSSPEFYWRGDDLTLDIHMLPSRAFDSPEEYRQTEQLLKDYNVDSQITPEFDARFDALAWQRIRRHPFRYYVVMPLLRGLDMWFRPRTELLYDATPIRWWEWQKHPIGSLFPIAYGLLNLALIATAAVGFARRRVPFAGMLLLYVLLRCWLLTTIENAEPKYTLECFPVILIAAGLALAGNKPPVDETSGDALAV